MNKRISLVLISILLLGAKCTEVDVTDPKVANALAEINLSFKYSYQKLLSDMGTRHFNVNRPVAFSGMLKTLENLGFTIKNTEGDYYIFVTGPAPTPLDAQDWEKVKDSDQSTLRKIASKHIGMIKGGLAKLEPDGLNIEGFVTILEAYGGVDITITFRMKEIKPQPPESILPRREYPPPTAARIGYEKIWYQFENMALPLAKMKKQT